MMYRSDQVRKVHLEITTKCSARCPQCNRNFLGDTSPSLPQVELSLADIKHIFPPSLVEQLEELHVCGNYGDATAAQDTVEVMRYFRKVNPGLILQIMTHGSARSVDWWAELAVLGVKCHFGIDGLEDTNHIYRRATNWKTIMRNATAFVAAGGTAIWNFIVFAHNEHQVEEARKLSQEMGFDKFIVKKTGRFLLRDEQEIYARDGSIAGTLRGPQSPAFKNEAIERLDRERMKNYLDKTPIYCKAANQRGIYVSADGFVFPCCYLGSIYPPGPSRKMVQLLERVELSSICAFQHSVAEIVNGPFFQEVVPRGWDVGQDRMYMCAQMCGSQDYVGSQTEARRQRSMEERLSV